MMGAITLLLSPYAIPQTIMLFITGLDYYQFLLLASKHKQSYILDLINLVMHSTIELDESIQPSNPDWQKLSPPAIIKGRCFRTKLQGESGYDL